MAKLGIQSKFSSPKWDFWQTILSRSDSNITPVLIDVYKNGGKLGSYKSAIKKFEIDITKSIEGYNLEEDLPWDIIQTNPPKLQLINEYRRLEKFI